MPANAFDPLRFFTSVPIPVVQSDSIPFHFPSCPVQCKCNAMQKLLAPFPEVARESNKSFLLPCSAPCC
jgi:hypothetical protein